MYMYAHAGTKEEMEELLQGREKHEDEQSEKESQSNHKEDRERNKKVDEKKVDENKDKKQRKRKQNQGMFHMCTRLYSSVSGEVLC